MSVVAGAWNVTVHTYMGDQSAVHTLEVNDGVLTGTVKDNGNGNVAEIYDGVVDGNKVSYKFTIKIPIGEMEFTINGEVVDGKYAGTSSNAMGSFDFEGTK